MTELDRLQQRLYMQARKVMGSEGRWVDPKETVVIYGTELEEKAAREAKWGRDFQREENRKLTECALICFAAMGFMAWIVWG